MRPDAVLPPAHLQLKTLKKKILSAPIGLTQDAPRTWSSF